MAELKYVPHAAARHLASRKTYVIGTLLTNMNNDFFAPMLNGIEQVVRKNGYNLLVATYRADNREHLAPPLGPHNTDGLLVFSDSLSDEDLQNLYMSGYPMVLVHRTPPSSFPIPSVTVENKLATRQLIDHLITVHRKKRIIFMRGPYHQEDSYWRETGYRAALETHGLLFDENLVLDGNFERDMAYDSMKHFLGNGQAGRVRCCICRG